MLLFRLTPMLCLFFIPLWLYAELEYEYDDACEWVETSEEMESPYSTTIAEASVDMIEPPLRLDIPTAIAMALKANRGVASAVDNVMKSNLNLQLSESAFDLKITPSWDVGCIGGGEAGTGATIGGSLELCKRFSYGTRVSVRPYITKDAHHYHSGVKAKIIQPLFRGFGQEYALSSLYAAQFSTRNAYRTAYLAGVNMVSRLISAMYSVLRQQTLMQINLDAQKRLENFYAAIKVKERIGLADSMDVYRTETEIKNGEDTLSNINEQLQDSLDRLREILGLPLGMPIELNLSTEFAPFEADPEKAVDQALLNRIEITQADDRWRETQRLSSLAQKNILPELDVVLDFSNIGRDEMFTQTFTNERDSRWGIGFMSSTDWDRTSQQIAYQQSLLSVTNAERNFEQAQDNVVLDVKRSIRVLQRAAKRIALQQEQIHNSEGGLRLAKLKFDRGLANNFDVIQAEKTLRQALTAYFTAIIDHKIGEYQFLAAIGLLVDKPPFCQ